MNLLEGLNENQKKAVIATGNVRIIAGAGSGKTRVLTHRIAYLIEQGVKSYTILAITFTNKAAKEMKERMMSLMGDVATGCHISTFHSLCVRILREDIGVIGYPKHFTILDGEDQKSLLKGFYKTLNLNHKEISYPSVISYISKCKQNRWTPYTAMQKAQNYIGEQTKAQLYQMYVDAQVKLYALDFDDLLTKVVAIFEEAPLILEKWQRRFHYIHVDEFQDTNDIQYKLIKYLSAERENVYVVGDPDQTIYSFRGADVSFIMNYEKDFKNPTTITLDRNYRSTQAILNGANALIKNNAHRLKKELYTSIESKHKITHYSGASEEIEADFICEQIDALISTEIDVNYEDFAILYRANYLSRAIEQSLIRHHIDYKVYGGLKFFERKEIKDAICYLRLINNRFDDLAFQRIINVPKRGVGPVALETINQVAFDHDCSMLDVITEHLDRLPLSTTIKQKLYTFGTTIKKYQGSDLSVPLIYDGIMQDVNYIETIDQETDISRLENLQELKNGMEDYIKRHQEEASLDHYLQELALFTSQDDIDDNPHYVSLMTIHMSKGLEFNYVFVAGLSENVFPSSRSLEEGPTGLEEERRLAYVAFTRAKKRLFLTDSQGFSFVSSSQKITSRFVNELEGYVDHVGINKTYRIEPSQIKPAMSSSKTIRPIETNNINDWAVQDAVVHATFGEGVVVAVKKDILEIAFPHPIGVKIMMANHGSIKRK